MQGVRTTAAPSTKEFTIPKGVAMISLLDPTTLKPTDWLDLGNSQAFTMTRDDTSIEHESTRDENSTIDATIVLKKAINMAFTVDNIVFDTLKFLFSSLVTTYVNPAIAGFTGASVVSVGGITKEVIYDLVDGSGNRLYSVKNTSMVLKTTNAIPVTLVEGTDYVLDAVRGTFHLIAASTVVATAITNAEGITLDATADATAKNLNQLSVFTASESTLKVALRFNQVDAQGGIEAEYQFHKLTLKPDGDYSLISSEFQTIGFTAKAEENKLASPASPTLTIRRLIA